MFRKETRVSWTRVNFVFYGATRLKYLDRVSCVILPVLPACHFPRTILIPHKFATVKMFRAFIIMAAAPRPRDERGSTTSPREIVRRACMFLFLCLSPSPSNSASCSPSLCLFSVIYIFSLFLPRNAHHERCSRVRRFSPKNGERERRRGGMNTSSRH